MRTTLVPLFALSLCLSVTPIIAQDADHDIIKLPDCSFKLSVKTSASEQTVWRLWVDVDHWNKFDTLLKYSYLLDEAKFEEGAWGYLRAKGAPRTKFELVEVNESESFIESLKLPLFQTIELQRYFEESEEGVTTFTHEVNFKGRLRFIMYALLAGTFKRELFTVMENLRDVAESEEKQESQFETETKSSCQAELRKENSIRRKVAGDLDLVPTREACQRLVDTVNHD